jgi:hypothetical protein
MADRFCGTVYLGGILTQAQFKHCKKLLKVCLENELDDDGSGAFVDCVESDFQDIIKYCTTNGIALSLHWNAKWEQEASVEYWVDGVYKQYFADGDGEIAVRLSELQKHQDMTVKAFIEKLELPHFPNLEIGK